MEFDYTEQHEEIETITPMKGRTNFLRSFKHKIQKSLFCSHSNKPHKVKSLEPYTPVDRNQNIFKDERFPNHPNNKDYYESLRRREGQKRFYSYSVQSSYRARSCIVPHDFSQSEPPLIRTRPFSCSDTSYFKKVTFEDDDEDPFTKSTGDLEIPVIRLQFADDTDFSGDDLFHKPPEYPETDSEDFFQSLKRRERMIKAKSEENLLSASKKKVQIQSREITKEIIGYVESPPYFLPISTHSDQNGIFRYIPIDNSHFENDSENESNTSIADDFLPTNYEESDLYETSETEDDVSLFDEEILVPIKSSQLLVSNTSPPHLLKPKNLYNSVVRSRYVDKMNVIEESECEEIIENTCIVPVISRDIPTTRSANVTFYCLTSFSRFTENEAKDSCQKVVVESSIIPRNEYQKFEVPELEDSFVSDWLTDRPNQPFKLTEQSVIVSDWSKEKEASQCSLTGEPLALEWANETQLSEDENSSECSINSEDSDKPFYEQNEFKFTMNDFQSIFCGMRVISEKGIQIPNFPATVNKSPIGMIKPSQKTRYGPNSLLIEIQKKDSVESNTSKDLPCIQTFCVYENPNEAEKNGKEAIGESIKTKTSSGISLELYDGKVLKSKDGDEDSRTISHRSAHNEDDLKIKVQYNY
ncbi:uncharacterized protein [Clytia hemisphaerica]|uniref:Uncharacterized protein n=1 Tax=Clytia hemisphaerica TaxID=252671 RepID=A0A7M5XM55_9CNID